MLSFLKFMLKFVVVMMLGDVTLEKGEGHGGLAPL